MQVGDNSAMKLTVRTKLYLWKALDEKKGFRTVTIWKRYIVPQQNPYAHAFLVHTAHSQKIMITLLKKYIISTRFDKKVFI